MENHEEIKNVLGVAFLYTIFTNVFSIPNRFITLVIMRGSSNMPIGSFLQSNALWIIVVTLIIILLSAYIKKINQRFYFDIFQNQSIRLISGTLVALEGLIRLSSSLPTFILSIKSAISLKASMQSGMVIKIITTDIISIVFILCQIIFGIYLVKYFRGKIKKR